jgi:hypothetical protein
MKNNPMTYYIEKSNKGEIPMIFPLNKVSKKQYENFSEKNRFEKLSNKFIKLRQYIINDELNEKYYIKEFIMKHGIYDEDLYTLDKLNNFSNFLFSNVDIDTSKCIKDIIVDACFYDPDEEQPKKMNKKPAEKLVYKRAVTDSEKQDFSVNFKDLSNTILDKRIRGDISNPKALMNTLENELAVFNDDVCVPYGKKARLQSLDVKTDNFQKKRNKIEQARKKNKLLEYIVWERNKNDI